LNAGQTILLQYLPQSNRNQSINQMEYMCQSVINSCSYKRNIQAYECCKNVIHKVATTNGLCWVFYDRYMSQDSSQPMQQFSLTLQMSRNSWYSQQTTPIHPGIDIYLKENVNDVMTIVNQLENPIRLLDKKGIHMKIHKEKRVDLRRKLCGSSLSEAELVDKNALARNATNILMCVIMVREYCPYDHTRISKIFLRDFSLRVNSTQVCTLDQYETCARPYVHMARPSSWLEPVPKDMLGAADISYCRRQNPYPCQTVSYPGIIDHYDLPSVYQNTQDFVARLVLQYTTTQVTEVLKTNGSNVYDLLSYIGYNIATWFTIGHIICVSLINEKQTLSSFSTLCVKHHYGCGGVKSKY
uniref:Helitron_like_N domain-containing protein n=1 Tax=Angiostrongylus cantonensis TaxID=6313 RepID=A0A0K0D0S8_ANGCA